jgi:NAD-dependent DNA ligase
METEILKNILENQQKMQQDIEGIKLKLNSIEIEKSMNERYRDMRYKIYSIAALFLSSFGGAVFSLFFHH